MDRVFLDANVLFSAAYREDSGLRALWALRNSTLLTSAYALEEARRNLDEGVQRGNLRKLAGQIETVPHEASNIRLPSGVSLPEDDRPILAAAISGQATHLLSGDRRAFGAYYEKVISGLLILRPADYLGSG